MTNINHKKLIATLPKLKQVITRVTEIMEDEHDLIEHHPETIEADELEIIQDNRGGPHQHPGRQHRHPHWNLGNH